MDTTKEINRMPPQDVEAEKAVLGAMLKSPEAVSDVMSILKPEDFYLKEHQTIYETMMNMHRKSIGIDTQTTQSALKEGKLLDIVGGTSYLFKLYNDAIVTSNAKYYADTVLGRARMRQLIDEANRINSRAHDGEAEPDEILDYAEQRIFEIAHRGQKRDYVGIEEVFVENIKNFQELEKNGGKLPGITTGFRDIDKTLGGLHKTDLIVLAARPGMGKTAFALNVAENAALNGASVMIFSLEMSKEQLGQRMLSMASNVEMEHMKFGTLSYEEWDAIDAAHSKFENTNLTIDDTSDISILEMKNKCRRLKAEKGLDLLIIDYLQLMSLGYKTDNRVGEISAITRSIKILAKELDVAVILLSQLSRNAEKRENARPQLADLRDSGSIEQDADIVIFLKRDKYYEDENAEADVTSEVDDTCDVIIAKHRSGETGTKQLVWIGKYTKFANLARTDNMNY